MSTELTIFIAHLRSNLDGLEDERLTATTKYRELESWSSMQALILISLIDTEYGVIINGEDIRKHDTIGGLCEYVLSRSAN